MSGCSVGTAGASTRSVRMVLSDDELQPCLVCCLGGEGEKVQEGCACRLQGCSELGHLHAAPAHGRMRGMATIAA